MRIAATALMLAATAATARAAPSPAEEAFERGRALLTAGEIVEACAAFEDSLRLDFQYGTLFNLAQCDVRRGKLATALAAFRRIALEDTVSATRARRAVELADELEPRVPKLHVTVAGLPAHEVTLDGAPADLARPLPVDLGTHELAVAGQHRTVTVTREGELVEIEIAVPSPAPPLAIDTPHAAEPVRTRTRTRTPALVTLGSGIAVAGAGLVVGGFAWRRWHDAEALARTDPMAADREVDHVRTLGNTSTALVAVGAVAIAVGVYLWRR